MESNHYYLLDKNKKNNNLVLLNNKNSKNNNNRICNNFISIIILYFPKILSNVKKKHTNFSLKILLIFCIFYSFFIPTVKSAGIGCFVCSSFNGSNPDCEDTFNSTIDQLSSKGSVASYQFPCWAFKKNRQGLFPADHCIKVSGYKSSDPSQSIVIRTCALDSGTLTADTEIVRISHCGHFKYEGFQYTGCVQACDTDGCNAVSTNFNLFFFKNLMLITSFSMFLSRLFIIHLL